MKSQIDHLVIGAATLEAGVAYVRETLGVEMPYGGEHLTMGTHNHLIRLGSDVFLEVIAPNPHIDPAPLPRWYGLDDPYVKQAIAQEPRLLTWVINTPDITKLLAQAKRPFGKKTAVSRNNLSWYFGLPEDGRLFGGGMLPYIIQWHTESHPAAKMADVGCRLEQLEIHHPYPDWLRSTLTSINAEKLVTIHSLPRNATPQLVAHIHTPSGNKQLLTVG